MGNKSRINTVKLGLNIPSKIQYSDTFWVRQSEDVPKAIQQDALIRKIIQDFIYKDEMLRYSVDRIEISRNMSETIAIKIFSSKPGRCVGPESANIKLLESSIIGRLKKSQLVTEPKVNIIVSESFKQEINASLIAQQIVKLMIERANYTQYIRRIIKYSGKLVKGIKIHVAGRLYGASIARAEVYGIGSVRRSSFCRSIDECYLPANTVKGVCGVRVIIDAGGQNV